MKLFEPRRAARRAPAAAARPPARGSGANRPMARVAFDAWPPWAKALAGDRLAGDLSVVDVLVRRCGGLDTQAFREWVAETFGVFARPCRYKRLAAAWSARYHF